MSLLPIAKHWFERRSIGDGITLLWEPYVAPLLRCNIWHVRGRDADLLIDTGLGVASLRAATSDLVRDDVLAVATHTHMDHMGSMHEFSRRAVHIDEAEAMRTASNALPLDPTVYDNATRAYFARVGYPIDDGLLTARPTADFDAATHLLRPCGETRLLVEGDVLDMGDRAFEVLHLPGHSPGSIGLFEARTGTLFSGDAIYDGPLLDDIPGADIAVYMRTMERLRALPVRVVHGGHDPSFDRSRLIALVDTYLQSKRQQRRTEQ